jgi:hypothetical protein
MHRDGEYSVWFRTSRGEGTGIVWLANGRISGGDCIFRYGGFYEFDEHEFTATLTTTRYAEGPTTVFGVDEVEAKITGMFKGATAVCSGTAIQAPELRFEARLFPRQPPADGPAVKRPPVTAVAAKPPKFANRLSRIWRD